LTVVTSVIHNRIVGKRDGEKKPKKDERMNSNSFIRYLRNWKERELAIEATWIAKRIPSALCARGWEGPVQLIQTKTQ
jgi:hypothetical protein